MTDPFAGGGDVAALGLEARPGAPKAPVGAIAGDRLPDPRIGIVELLCLFRQQRQLLVRRGRPGLDLAGVVGALDGRGEVVAPDRALARLDLTVGEERNAWARITNRPATPRTTRPTTSQRRRSGFGSSLAAAEDVTSPSRANATTETTGASPTSSRSPRRRHTRRARPRRPRSPTAPRPRERAPGATPRRCR